MKRITIILCAIVTLGLVSCKKETIIQKPSAKTYNFTIRASDWIKNKSGSYYFRKAMPPIDAVTLANEGVLVYFQHPAADASGDIQLPYVYNYSAYSYEVSNGWLTFDIQDTNNLINSVAPDYNILVKVVIIPSEYVNL